jgi:hypothetical protein
MMTPKEKSIELVNKFEQLKPVKMSDYSRIYFPAAKLCALIAVDEILDAIDWDYYEGSQQTEHMYWKKVKQEIELL